MGPRPAPYSATPSCHAQYEALCDENLDHYQPDGLEGIELVEQLVMSRISQMEERIRRR